MGQRPAMFSTEVTRNRDAWEVAGASPANLRQLRESLGGSPDMS